MRISNYASRVLANSLPSGKGVVLNDSSVRVGHEKSIGKRGQHSIRVPVSIAGKVINAGARRIPTVPVASLLYAAFIEVNQIVMEGKIEGGNR